MFNLDLPGLMSCCCTLVLMPADSASPGTEAGRCGAVSWECPALPPCWHGSVGSREVREQPGSTACTYALLFPSFLWDPSENPPSRESQPSSSPVRGDVTGDSFYWDHLHLGEWHLAIIALIAAIIEDEVLLEVPLYSCWFSSSL